MGELKVSIGKPPAVDSEMQVLMSSPAVLCFMTPFAWSDTEASNSQTCGAACTKAPFTGRELQRQRQRNQEKTRRGYNCRRALAEQAI